jgi:hypothetical protein
MIGIYNKRYNLLTPWKLICKIGIETLTAVFSVCVCVYI